MPAFHAAAGNRPAAAVRSSDWARVSRSPRVSMGSLGPGRLGDRADAGSMTRPPFCRGAPDGIAADRRGPGMWATADSAAGWRPMGRPPATLATGIGGLSDVSSSPPARCIRRSAAAPLRAARDSRRSARSRRVGDCRQRRRLAADGPATGGATDGRYPGWPQARCIGRPAAAPIPSKRADLEWCRNKRSPDGSPARGPMDPWRTADPVIPMPQRSQPAPTTRKRRR
jgi:hypothetical protein